MNKEQKFELRERAVAILGLNRTYSDDELKKSYYRLIKKVHPDNHKGSFDGISNDDLTKLIIQAYHFLKGGNTGSMLEDDNIIFRLTGRKTSFRALGHSDNEWDAARFYDSFNNSIWPESATGNSFKFGGIC